jgi:hypothetical protein
MADGLGQDPDPSQRSLPERRKLRHRPYEARRLRPFRSPPDAPLRAGAWTALRAPFGDAIGFAVAPHNHSDPLRQWETVDGVGSARGQEHRPLVARYPRMLRPPDAQACAAHRFEEPAAVVDHGLAGRRFVGEEAGPVLRQEREAAPVEEEPAGEGDPVGTQDAGDLVQVVLALRLVQVGEDGVRQDQAEPTVLDGKRQGEPQGVARGVRRRVDVVGGGTGSRDRPETGSPGTIPPSRGWCRRPRNGAAGLLEEKLPGLASATATEVETAS